MYGLDDDALKSHYKPDWTDEDKAMFHAMVQEEMQKLERERSQPSTSQQHPEFLNHDNLDYSHSYDQQHPRGYNENGSWEEQQVEYKQTDTPQQIENYQSKSISNTSHDSYYGPPQPTKLPSTIDEDVFDGGILSQIGASSIQNRKLNQQRYAQQLEEDKKSVSSFSNNEESNFNNSENPLASKVGSYEAYMRNQRKTKQQEYAEQLTHQLEYVGINPNGSKVVGRSSSRIRNPLSAPPVDSYKGTGLNIGLDPATKNSMERAKRQEYARMLDSQVQSSPNTKHKPVDQNRNLQNESYRRPVINTNGTSLAIGADAFEQQQLKKERQQAYFRQLAEDSNKMQAEQTNRKMMSQSTYNQSVVPVSILRGKQETPKIFAVGQAAADAAATKRERQQQYAQALSMDIQSKSPEKPIHQQPVPHQRYQTNNMLSFHDEYEVAKEKLNNSQSYPQNSTYRSQSEAPTIANIGDYSNRPPMQSMSPWERLQDNSRTRTPPRYAQPVPLQHSSFQENPSTQYQQRQYAPPQHSSFQENPSTQYQQRQYAPPQHSSFQENPSTQYQQRQYAPPQHPSGRGRSQGGGASSIQFG